MREVRFLKGDKEVGTEEKIKKQQEKKEKGDGGTEAKKGVMQKGKWKEYGTKEVRSLQIYRRETEGEKR